MTSIPSPPAHPCIRPRPLERLEAEIVTLATQLTAATARFVALVGEFDAAEGWRDWAMRSTAHWLSWKCGVGMAAGREHVRVASRRFAAGCVATLGSLAALARLASAPPRPAYL